MITPQTVLFIAGIASLVLAVVLAIVAATYFVRADIRGVMDDLSGKTRQGGAGVRASAGARSTKRRRKSAPVQRAEAMPTGAEVREGKVATATSGEDELETVLDTKLRKVPYVVPGINSDSSGIGDDVSTLVTTEGGYHQTETNMQEADQIPTEVDDGLAKASGTFVVTRSIISINSGEVITAG